METALEKRKLQRLGGSLFLSLPRNWLDQFSLKKGAEIFVSTDTEGRLILAPLQTQQREELDITLIFGPYLYRQLLTAYLRGITTIGILKKDGFSKAEREAVLNHTQGLMNTEIIEETSTKITLQQFSAEEVSLKMLVQRMFFLTHSMLLDLAIAKTKTDFENIKERDKTVGRFYMNIIMHLRAALTGRLLVKEYTLPEVLDLRLLILHLEQIGDQVKGLAYDALEGRKCKIEDLHFLAERYQRAFTSFVEHDVQTAERFWDTEKQDRRKLAYHEKLLRMYDHIKDITDLVI
ncbi:hypothetical protein HYT55_00965 [Candidatus Woesearchaeota archaeon]|nr:hypothetical protein [Candidatus Woesearchaeota archaeon]